MKSPGFFFLWNPYFFPIFFFNTQCTGLRPAVKTFNLLPRKFLFSCVFSSYLWLFLLMMMPSLSGSEQSKDQWPPKGAMMKGGGDRDLKGVSLCPNRTEPNRVDIRPRSQVKIQKDTPQSLQKLEVLASNPFSKKSRLIRIPKVRALRHQQGRRTNKNNLIFQLKFRDNK